MIVMILLLTQIVRELFFLITLDFCPHSILESDVELVKAWAKKNGARNVQVTRSRDFITAEFPAKALESAFGVEFSFFHHKANGTLVFQLPHQLPSGRTLVRTTGHVVLPDEISDKIDVVSGLTDFFDHAKERSILTEMKKRQLRKDQPSSAPGFRSLKGSERNINAFMVIYCQDGTPAKGFDQGPCEGKEDVATFATQACNTKHINAKRSNA